MQETNSYLYPRFEVLVKNKRLVPEDRQISRASIDTQHASMNKEERLKWMWMQAYTIATGFQKILKPLRQFIDQEEVLIRNFGQGPRWMRGKISRKRGPVTYDVEVGEQIVQRHIDQMLAATDERLADSGIVETDTPLAVLPLHLQRTKPMSKLKKDHIIDEYYPLIRDHLRRLYFRVMEE